jgi:hypothetical protein
MDNQHAFYVYNKNSIVSFTGPTLEMTDESKFNTLGDRIIASNFYDGSLIFFSLNHGILKTKDNTVSLSIDEETSFNQSIDASYMNTAPGQQSSISFLNRTPHHNTSVSVAATATGVNQTYNADLSNISIQSMDDMSFSFKNATNNRQSFDFTFSNLGQSDQYNLNRLKEAFQCYLKKEERDSQELVAELLRSNMLEKKIDFVCIELSEKLIDDMPAHDPRWAEMGIKSAKSMNTNLIISNQLKSKIRLHEYFVTFLKKFQIWDKLTTVSYNGRDVESRVALQEHGEKLQLALAIREHLYTKYAYFIYLRIKI